MEHFEPAPEILISDLNTLKVYFDPMRIRIIHALAGQPRSVTEIAEMLGVPFTRLYYHIHLLESHGLIRLVEARSLSGAAEEKYYRVAARMFVIDRALLTPGTPNRADMLDLILDSALGQTIEDIRRSAARNVIDLEAMSPAPDALLCRRSIFRLTREQAQRLHQALLDLMTQVQEGPYDDAARAYGFAVALYPSAFTDLPTSEEDEAAPGEA
jgi:DNA-binding transcriptional ArsR family regulator